MRRLRFVALLLVGACTLPAQRTPATTSIDSAARLRVATFNVSFYAGSPGALATALRHPDAKQRAVAAVIQRVRPDVLLLNEFDQEAGDAAAEQFLALLRSDQPGGKGIEYPHHFHAAVNTGMQSGLDLDGDGRRGGPGDAWGFGAYPGQYGMLVLSRFPIDAAALRSFRNFRWHDMPDALRPVRADGTGYYAESTWRQLRLSSKSHWDLPIDTPLGRLHVLAMHPTPPVFDGAEDRHGRRNHDEIRLFADYLDPARGAYLVDDQGRRGGIVDHASFVLLGDFNADPLDGESVPGTVQQLLDHPRIHARFVPRSAGAAEKSRTDGPPNDGHRGDPAEDTGDFLEPASGNLRIDYVLPSADFRIVDGGVFWPAPGSPDAALAGASDHHLVWLDLARLP